MSCCKCEEHKWEEPQPVEYVDDEGKGYCLFHAPSERKSSSAEGFNFRVKSHIQKFLNTHGTGSHKVCQLSGTIFPGDILFRGFDQESRLPGLDFSHAQFEGETDFSFCNFRSDTSFIDASFSRGVTFNRTIFHAKADFSMCKTEGIADFAYATFESAALFQKSCFASNAVFFKVTFKKQAAFVYSQFLDDANFRISTFDGRSTFLESYIVGAAHFSDVKFFSDVNFTNTQFNSLANFKSCTFVERAYFSETEFGDIANFSQIKSDKNLVRLHKLSASTLKHICFSSMETEFLSFKLCEEPYILYPETAKPTDYKSCEELYRSLKLKAASEHDQPMTSWWHYREKLMKLEGVKKRYPRSWWLHWLGIYYWTSGFGERWVPPFRTIRYMLYVCILILALGGVKSTEANGAYTVLECQWWPLRLPSWEGVKNVGTICLSLLKYLLLIKEESIEFKPIYGWAEFLILLFTRLIIPIQAAFFAIALRNAYRR